MIVTAETPILQMSSLTAALPASESKSARNWFHEFVQRTGLPCACFDRRTLRPVATSDGEFLLFTPDRLNFHPKDVRGIEVYEVGHDLLYFVVPLPCDDRYLLGGITRKSPTAVPVELVMASMDAGWTEGEFNEWLATVPVCNQQILERLLDCGLTMGNQAQAEANIELELKLVEKQVDYAYEQINLLHSLTQNLHLSRPTEELASVCLERLEPLINCLGAAIVLQSEKRPLFFLSQGHLPFDQAGLCRLLSRFHQYDWSLPLVRNQLQDSLLGADFPGLRNLIITPIGDGPHRHGWIVTCNRRGDRDFSNVEATLLGSIATILGTHARNIQLFDEHDDLLPSFVRSLVSSLDAKDRHTRGHSERVALIARRLGKHLRLPESDLDDIYLSSLLHDLGKIGVDDRILSKPGRLTAEEFAQIQQHPIIGYQILSPLKNLKAILPGVRNHHEAFNGQGYPDKLQGEAIPLMARIIAVADSYDAMVSDRPYRVGMPLDKLEDILRRGSGKQWDPKVIDAYFATRDDVRALCESYSPHVGNLLDSNNLSQSGIFSARNFVRPTA